MAAVGTSVWDGRNHFEIVPVFWSRTLAHFSISAYMAGWGRLARSMWLQVWLPNSWLPFWITGTMSGLAASQLPTTKKVSRTFRSAAWLTSDRVIAGSPAVWKVRATLVDVA